MDPIQLIASLTPEERIQMQMRGLRPGNERDVQIFKSGKQLTMTEKINRAKVLMGNSNNLGGAGEVDINPKKYNPDSYNEIEPTRNFRKELNEEMDNYATTGKVFNTDDLLSLKKPSSKPSNVSFQKIEEEGFNDAKEYLNAFIVNLQEPNSKSRMTIFKNLQNCLKKEIAYKTNVEAYKAYRNGVVKAERAMFTKLQ